MKKFLNKITSILLAVCMFFMLSACNTTTGTEVPTITTTTAKTTATTVTTTVSVETDKTEEFVTTKVDTRDPNATIKLFPNISGESETTTLNTTSVTSITEIINDVSHIELLTCLRETDYTEFESIAILWSTYGIISYGRDLIIYFPSSNRSEDPCLSIVEGWGCFPNAIINTFENSDSVFKNSFIDLTDSSPVDMYNYIDQGIPVMVWVTEGLAEPKLVSEYGDSKMYGPKECVVLAGYSDSAVVVWSVIEEDYVTYDRNLFEQRFKEMGSMALVFNPIS